MNQGDSTRLDSQGLPALRHLGVRQPLNSLMAVPPLPPGSISNEYARLRTGNGSIYRSFGDSLEIGAGRLHFHIPHTGWYVVGVQPETLGERGDYTIQVVRHARHSVHLFFPNKAQCEPLTP
jgi:hypothetical protein